MAGKYLYPDGRITLHRKIDELPGGEIRFDYLRILIGKLAAIVDGEQRIPSGYDFG
jgi:hypothetical protein